LLLNAFKSMCLFCVPGTHNQKCTVVPFISTCYFARVVANTLCDVGFASRGLRFRVTCILGMGVPMTWDSIELMCLFCAPGTHDQKCMVVPFISTCYFARVVANTLCDVGFASQGLRFHVTRILGMGVPMTRDSIESWIKLHILSEMSTLAKEISSFNRKCQHWQRRYLL
jgi:hypothetical protein